MTSRVEMRGVGKRYVKVDDRFVGGGRVGGLRRSRREPFWALRDVDLDVQPGECVGIIGRNGSGKSTLLALLAGVTAPSAGRLRVSGRIAPLLSVGVGFHPEMTGRENVFVNGTVLGVPEPELRRRFDEIVDFAGIESFLDTPVKFYSSGMFVRLGFAVAVCATPDVLLVDEVLAVGDLAFQVKSFERMREMQSEGTTVVVVTHNLQAMEVLCTRGVVLERGTLRHDGTVRDAVGHYHRLLSAEPGVGYPVSSGSRVLALSVTQSDGTPAASIESGARVKLSIEVDRNPDDHDPQVDIVLADEQQEIYRDGVRWSQLGLGTRRHAVVEVEMSLPLTTGTYSLSAQIAPVDGLPAPDATVPPTFVRVTLDRPVNGVIDLAAVTTLMTG